MATPEPAAQSSPAQDSSAPATAGQEEAPRERGPEAAAAAAEAEKVEGEVQEEEEEEECGFCLFMKAGGCKDVFVAWEECVKVSQEEGTDMVERCYEATSNLKKCMDAHADYYAPVLAAEEAVNERAEAEAAAAADAARGEPASDAEKKEEAVPQQSDSPALAVGEGKNSKKEEAVAEKV